MNHLGMLTRYRSWADRLVYDALGGAPDDVLTAPRSIVFGTLLRTLHHVYAMDKVWQANLLGESHEFATRNPASCPPFARLREEQEAMDTWYEDYADSLSPSDLGQVVCFRFIGGDAAEMTREAILLHVVNHATYHRGHVADMMYASDITPPTTDLPVFAARFRQDNAGQLFRAPGD